MISHILIPGQKKWLKWRDLRPLQERNQRFTDFRRSQNETWIEVMAEAFEEEGEAYSNEPAEGKLRAR